MLVPARADFDTVHPDMDIFINTDKSPALILSKVTGSPLSGFKMKRGAVVPLSVYRAGLTDRHRAPHGHQG